MMKIGFRLFSMALFFLLLFSWQPSSAATEVEVFLKLLEEEAAYKEGLEKAAQSLYAAKEGELTRYYRQKLKTAQKVLREQALSDLQPQQNRLRQAIMRGQLQLIFVTFSPLEQRQKLKAIGRLQTEWEQLQTEAEMKLGEGLNELRLESERALRQDLAKLAADLTKAIEDDYAQAFLSGLDLRSVFPNGSY